MGSTSSKSTRTAIALGSKHSSTLTANNVTSTTSVSDERLSKCPVHAFRDMPGPKSLPFIGNVWRYVIGEYNIEKLDVCGHYNLAKYGKRVREHVYGALNIVHLFDPKDIEQVFRTEGRYPERRSHRALGKFRRDRPETYNSGGIFCENGAEWYRLRKISQQTLLNPNIVNGYIPDVEAVTQELIDLIRSRRDSLLEMADFEYDLYKWSLENISLVTMDTRLGCLNPNLAPDSDANRLIKAAHLTIDGVMRTEMGQMDLWQKFPRLSRAYQKVVKGQTEMAVITEKYLKIKQEKLKTEPDDKTVLGLFFKNPNATPKDVLGTVLDLLLAGIDTTAFSAGFVLYYLARTPEAQLKLRKEIVELLPSKSTPITSELIAKMVYLKACVKEAMRLRPLAVGVGRLTTQDVTIGNHSIPQGTMIITQNQVACRQEENFKDADAFIPERWFVDRHSRPSSFLSLPFGFGPRACVGRRFSDMNTYVLLAKLIRNFDVQYHYEDIGVVTRLINIPDKDMKFRFVDLK